MINNLNINTLMLNYEVRLDWLALSQYSLANQSEHVPQRLVMTNASVFHNK